MFRLMGLDSASGKDDRSRLFWRLQALGWGGALLMTTGMGGILHSPAGEGILVALFRSVFGFVASSVALRPLLRALRHRGQAVSGPGLLATVSACGLLGLADTASAIGFASLSGIDLEQPGVRTFLAASAFIRAVLYGFWSILYFAVHYRLDTQRDQLRAARAEAAARSSELQMLRSQVNPHFLFNALNSILAESGDASSVRRITLALADYLRFSLAQRGEVERLGTELDALESYLRVEKARFEDGLEYRIEADEAARRAPAPVALVQPLLENAIKYGQRSAIRPLQIAVSAVAGEDSLAVSVVNTGEWTEEDSPTKTGLSNLRRRLALLYGDAASLSIAKENGEVRVHVRLPVARAMAGSKCESERP